MTSVPKSQHHFVLVHGAGHGAWCWTKLIPALEKGGNRVTTVDLASAGASPVTAGEVTTLEQYNQPLEDLFKTFSENEKVVLVGHSMGGINITLTSECFPKNISVAVYLSANMPSIGISFLESMESNQDLVLPDLTWIYNYKVEGAQGSSTSQHLAETTLKNYFYNKCSEEDFLFAKERVRPIPPLPAIIGRPLGTIENYGSVPRVYIIALEDKMVTRAFGRKSIQLNPPNDVFEIDADHSSFFSNVEILDKILKNIAAKYDNGNF